MDSEGGRHRSCRFLNAADLGRHERITDSPALVTHLHGRRCPMHARNGVWPSAVSALGIVFLGVAVAAAQYGPPTRLPDTGYASPAGPGDSASSYDSPADAPPVVSQASYVSGDDLAARVADLEASLKKMKAAETAAKKKAAEKPTVVDRRSSSCRRGRVQPGRPEQDRSGQRRERRRDPPRLVGRPGNRLRGVRLQVAMVDGIRRQGQGSRQLHLVNELPVLGHVRVGYFKEPFGLERLMSSN